MSHANCSRKWQVSAARDGRLRGKDLEHALRHCAACAECAREERELAALGAKVSSLPVLTRDSVTTRRARQRLMAALNEAVLELPRPKLRWRVASGVALAIAVTTAYWPGWKRPAASGVGIGAFTSVVRVRATPTARWSELDAPALDRVDFQDGVASFEVRPHAGRRVVIGLPDGEIEDLGTVFELRVAEQRTRKISVSEGRVAVRLLGRPIFTLQAGQAWELESASPTLSPTVAPSSEPSTVGTGSRGFPKAAAPHAARRAQPPSEAPASNAEDDAYLQIVELLRQAKDNEARTEAKAYLLRFPNGFRRIEVLNIAMRAADGAGLRGSTH